jgi:hypothetical protein
MKITINNTEHEFKFSFLAIRELEKVTGKKLNEVLEQMQAIQDKGLDFSVILDIAYCGLKYTSNSMTIEQVGELLDNGNRKDLEAILTGFMEGINKYLQVDPNLNSQTS